MKKIAIILVSCIMGIGILLTGCSDNKNNQSLENNQEENVLAESPLLGEWTLNKTSTAAGSATMAEGCIFISVLDNRESEDGMLALKETIKTISKEKKVTQIEMAEILGISKQNFSNKIQRNTFSPDELVKIADKLGMELAFVDKDAEIKNGNKYVIKSAE